MNFSNPCKRGDKINGVEGRVLVIRRRNIKTNKSELFETAKYTKRD